MPKFNLQNPLSKLAEETGGTLENDLIRLKNGQGYGFIHEHNPDPGLTIRTWDMSRDYPVELYDENRPPQKGYNFKLIILLTPESCVLKKLGLHLQFSRLAQKSVLLASEDVNLQFELSPGLPSKIIDIRFDYAWLVLNMSGPALLMTQKLIQHPRSPLIQLEPLPTGYEIGEESSLAGLPEKEVSGLTDKLLITRLISDFLERSLNQQAETVSSKDDFYTEKLREVETILQSYLQKDLPKLNVIARQVALSESTLKRHFKGAFGKNVYGYYLEKKMELARRLLLENSLTVRQVASSLGYENVSNFIEIFRKNCGCSPGSVKKSRLLKALGQGEGGESPGA